ncbi:hypothetical protein SAMN04487912_105120 [Arthrobacter sp. cf158]|uniref:hypothetical protein n=1 Tax=Arthrobacter sp. cf158 TaxID=1761744 RepID=UPI00089AA62D|nr:hypothetical protein [Arthrobacter sp. cf158]SDW86005.1 hypothetical protein SAMN04487912_105120 [Arthrobacter sp. cf158]
MSRLVVDPQTLRALQLALKSTLDRVQAEHSATSNAARRTLDTVDAAVKLRQARVQQCQTALAACRNSEREDCSIEAAALAEAQRHLAAALNARRLVSQATADYELQARASLKRLESLQAQGHRYLTFKLDKVAAVNAGGPGGTGSVSVPGSITVGLVPPAGLGIHSLPGLPAGFVMVPVDQIDQTENPISGPQDFGKGYSIEDLDYAFDLLSSQVLPGLANGSSPSSFAVTDKANGSYGTRSLSDTYSGFFGGDAIRLERRPDGTYAITNGRHRVYVASRFGREYVPAKIVGGLP